MDLDDTATGDVFFTSQMDTEDNNTDSRTTDFIRRSTTGLHPISPRDNSQIANLDDTETGTVVSMAQTDTGGGHGTDSEIVGHICYSTSAPHLTSPQDDDHIMDIDDMETGDVFFTSQADTEDDKNTDSEMTDFIRRSTPAPHSASHDSNQMVGVDHTETVDVTSVAQTAAANGHSTYSEPINPIRRSTPPASPQDSSQIMDLDPNNIETGDINFISQADVENESDTDSEMVNFSCRSTSAPHLTPPPPG